MLTDKETFYAVRQDTLACLLRFPPLYFKFSTGAVRALLEVVDSAGTAGAPDASAIVEEVNDHLSVLRGVSVSYHRLGDAENAAHLRALLGDEADTYASVHGVNSFEVGCHTPVERTQTLPAPLSTFNQSTFSDSYDVGIVMDTAPPFLGVGSGSVSGTYVATVLGGSLETESELGRGRGPLSLEEFINGESRTTALSLRVGAQSYVLYPELAITALNRDALENELYSNDARWVVRTEYVRFEKGRGHTGDIYRYTPSTTLYEISDVLREGDALVRAPHVKVKKVLGHRVTLTAPAVFTGSAEFCSPDYIEWRKRAHAFVPLTLSAVDERERLTELRAALVPLKRELRALLKTGASPKEGTATDIKDAHYNVGANHAYNLLERGRFDEYRNLTETQASTAKLLSEAARAIKAGSLL